MDKEKQTVLVLLIAGLLVTTTGSLMLTGAYREPPIEGEMRLSYSVSGGSELQEFDGSIWIDMYHERGYTGILSSEPRGALPMDLIGLPNGPFFTLCGSYLDHLMFHTPWGIKNVQRWIAPIWDADGMVGICIEYRGAQTFLAYRMELITPDYRAIYDLVETDIDVIEHVDRHDKDMDERVSLRHFTEGFTDVTNGGFSYHLGGPLPYWNYQYNFTGVNYAFYYWRGIDIWSMVFGGEFSYDRDRSLVGNGTVEFTMEESLGLWAFVPIGNGTHSSFLQVKVVRA